MKTPEELNKEIATAKLMKSLSRRSVLKRAAVGAAGVAVVGAGAGAFFWSNKGPAAHASGGGEGPEDTITQILSIAATAEELAVTFYNQGIDNAHKMGIQGANLDYLKAAIVEEQIHRDFLVAAGGTPLTNTFSFPNGAGTFTDLKTFIVTLSQLEEAFVAAYLAAVNEFSLYGQARLAQIAAQILGVEAEHRALGRSINPETFFPNDYAFEPALVESVGDAVDVLAAAGYLSPKPGNSYTYSPVSTDSDHVVYRQPFLAKEDKD